MHYQTSQLATSQPANTPTVITVTSTKGGVSKTTTAANLGALPADLGFRVLLIDADIQPSLSGYFESILLAPEGLVELVYGPAGRGNGAITPHVVSQTNIPRLHIVRSNIEEQIRSGGLDIQAWLAGRMDRMMVFKRALSGSFVRANYDVVIFDTQGARGPLQEAAAVAANHSILCPVNPTTLAATEFSNGTLAMLENLNALSDLGIRTPPVRALLSKVSRTNDAKDWATAIREQYRQSPDVTVLETQIPEAAVFCTAATLRMPAYMCDRDRRTPASAHNTLHSLVWELFPNLKGMYANEEVAK